MFSVCWGGGAGEDETEVAVAFGEGSDGIVQFGGDFDVFDGWCSNGDNTLAIEGSKWAGKGCCFTADGLLEDDFNRISKYFEILLKSSSSKPSAVKQQDL